MVSFSWDFLTTLFHGAGEHSPGVYYIPKHAGGSIIPSRTFYAMEAENEPFLPAKPCDHGAKLTAFFNPNDPFDGGEAASEDVPLFISLKGQPSKYVYFGTYSQTRWSDKVGYDVMCEHVPASVKAYWADQLADPGRAEWVTKALMKAFFPMPGYEGPMSAGTPIGSQASAIPEQEEKKAKKLKRAVNDYLEELHLWEKEAKTKVALMKKSDILKAFEKVYHSIHIHPNAKLT